ncbi:MAG: hypothetical protein ACRDRN_11380 [Sciscionella sp.]
MTLRNEFGSGSTAAIMRFRVGAGERDTTRIPDRLAILTPLHSRKAVTTRTMVFRDRGEKSGWEINGGPFSPSY